MTTSTVLIRDHNGNTLARTEIDIDPERIGPGYVSILNNREGVVVTLELRDGDPGND